MSASASARTAASRLPRRSPCTAGGGQFGVVRECRAGLGRQGGRPSSAQAAPSCSRARRPPAVVPSCPAGAWGSALLRDEAGSACKLGPGMPPLAAAAAAAAAAPRWRRQAVPSRVTPPAIHSNLQRACTASLRLCRRPAAAQWPRTLRPNWERLQSRPSWLARCWHRWYWPSGCVGSTRSGRCSRRGASCRLPLAAPRRVRCPRPAPCTSLCLTPHPLPDRLMSPAGSVG